VYSSAKANEDMSINTVRLLSMAFIKSVAL
jgi:hypothetical protein